MIGFYLVKYKCSANQSRAFDLPQTQTKWEANKSAARVLAIRPLAKQLTPLFPDIDAGYERIGFPGEASCETGEYSALPHGSIKPQTIREGAMVLIDDGCTGEGYESDITRAFVYGKPSDKMLRCFDIVHRAQAAALATARPGVACGAVDAAARKVIADAGYGPGYTHFTHRVGHGIGMDGHEWPYLVRGNSLLLEEGMTFSDEPGIYIRGEFGIRFEDDMHITADGARLFTGPSKSLDEPFGG